MNLQKISKITLTVCMAAVFGVLQYSSKNGFGDPDGWYHLALGKMYALQGIVHNFPWLPNTILKDSFFDQQFLYHLLLGAGGTIIWAKIIAIVAGLALYCSVVHALNTIKVSQGWIWAAIILTSSSGLLYRTGLVKGGIFGTALFIYAVSTTLRKSYWPLFGIGALWALTHGSFVLLLPTVILCSLFAHQDSRKVLWKQIGWALLGILLGLALHPHTHAVIDFLKVQLFIPWYSYKGVSVGGEWQPLDILTLVRTTSPLLPIWILTLCISAITTAQTSKKIRQLLILLSSITFITSVLYMRFVELWAPLAGIFVASEYSTIVVIAKQTFHSFTAGYKTRLTTGLLIVTLSLANTIYAFQKLANSSTVDSFQGAVQWLERHTNTGEVVVNVNWDVFPALFYLNRKNYYAAGLDTSFMYAHSANLYWKWKTLPLESPAKQDNEIIYNTIRSDFGAKLLLLENIRNKWLREQLQNDTRFKIVYTDNYSTIFLAE
jgi:hypothetical protein